MNCGAAIKVGSVRGEITRGAGQMGSRACASAKGVAAGHQLYFLQVGSGMLPALIVRLGVIWFRNDRRRTLSQSLWRCPPAKADT